MFKISSTIRAPVEQSTMSTEEGWCPIPERKKRPPFGPSRKTQKELNRLCNAQEVIGPEQRTIKLVSGARSQIGVYFAMMTLFFFDDDDDDPNHQITRTNYRGSCANNSAGEGGSPPHAHQDSCSAGSTRDAVNATAQEMLNILVHRLSQARAAE